MSPWFLKYPTCINITLIDDNPEGGYIAAAYKYMSVVLHREIRIIKIDAPPTCLVQTVDNTFLFDGIIRDSGGFRSLFFFVTGNGSPIEQLASSWIPIQLGVNDHDAPKEAIINK